MLDRLKAKKAEIERLREERGATDPILIVFLLDQSGRLASA